jgi:nucleotide-binding universal stress UspA family protein
MKILLAADGSPYTQAAAQYLARHLGALAAAPELHVLHVHAAMPFKGRVNAAVGKGAVERYQDEESEAALAIARAQLKDIPGVVYAKAVGEIAPSVEEYVKKHGIDLVVMGSRGHGALAGAVLGSVARDCMACLAVPVMVVPNR